MATMKKGLNYIKNTGGNATWFHFVDDWAPVGHLLFQELEDAGLVRQDGEMKIHLTDKGKEKLKELNDG